MLKTKTQYTLDRVQVIERHNIYMYMTSFSCNVYIDCGI